MMAIVFAEKKAGAVALSVTALFLCKRLTEQCPRSVLVAVSFILLSRGSPVSSSEPPDELTAAPSLTPSVNLIRSYGSRSGTASSVTCQKCLAPKKQQKTKHPRRMDVEYDGKIYVC